MIKKNYLPGILCSISLLLICLKPDASVLYVKNALKVCYENVIPSLFPFMVLSGYLAGTDFAYIISLPFNWYGRLLKIKDKKFATFLLLSMIGGFAVGSNFLNRLKEKGYPDNSIYRLSPAFINNSFSFCVFAVGAGMLSNFHLGIMIYISLIISSLICSFLLSFLYKYNIVNINSDKKSDNISFAQSVNSGVRNILTICGFVVIFYIICQVISLYISNNLLETFIFILSEVTVGCLKTAVFTGKNPYYICFVLSFIPVSTLCQVFYFTQDINIMKSIIISRIIHTPLSLCIFSIISNLFPVAAYTNTLPENIIIRNFRYSGELSAVLFICTLFFILIFDSNKIFTKSPR